MPMIGRKEEERENEGTKQANEQLNQRNEN